MPDLVSIAMTALIAGAVAFFLVLAIWGEALVWRFPSYARFRLMVQWLEDSPIISIKGSSRPPSTLGMAAAHLLPSMFVVEDARLEGVTIGQCFGAMFLNKESIEEEIFRVQISASLVLLFLFIGTFSLFVFDPDRAAPISKLNAWGIVPFIMKMLMETHWVLTLELFAVCFSVVYLLNSSFLLRKIVRQVRR